MTTLEQTRAEKEILRLLDIESPMTFEHLQQRVAAERNVILRAIARLEDDGLIRLHNGSIAKPDERSARSHEIMVEVGERALLRRIRAKPGISVRSLTEGRKISPKKLKSHLQSLLDTGLVELRNESQLYPLTIDDNVELDLQFEAPRGFQRLELSVEAKDPARHADALIWFLVETESSRRARELKCLALEAKNSETTSRFSQLATWINAFAQLDLTSDDRAALTGRFRCVLAPGEQGTHLRYLVDKGEISSRASPKKLDVEAEGWTLDGWTGEDVRSACTNVLQMPAGTGKTHAMTLLANLWSTWGFAREAQETIRERAWKESDPLRHLVAASIEARHGESPARSLREATMTGREWTVGSVLTGERLLEMWPREWLPGLGKSIDEIQVSPALKAPIQLAAAHELADQGKVLAARQMLAAIDLDSLRHDSPAMVAETKRTGKQLERVSKIASRD